MTDVKLKQKPPKKAISFSLLTLASLILINPVPLLFDLLPDALAYVLIILAIRRAAPLMADMDEAKESMTKMLIVSAVKIPAFFVMLMIWGGDTNQRSIVGVFTLVFSILEICFALPAFRQLFVGFYRLGENHGFSAALQTGEGALRMAPGKVERLTVSFIIVRCVCSCVPELFLVPIAEEGAGIYQRLFPPALILGALVSLVMGCIWCCFFIAYLRRMATHEEALEQLSCRAYEKDLAMGVGRYRRIKMLCILYVIAVCCTFDIAFDGVPFLPDVLAAMAFLGVAALLWNTGGRCIDLVCAGLGYLAACLVEWRGYSLFFGRYDEADVYYRSREALDAYWEYILKLGIKEAFLILTVVLTFVHICRVVKQETVRPNFAPEYQGVAERVCRGLTRKQRISMILGVASATVSFVNALGYLSVKTTALTTSVVYSSNWDWFLMVVWACQITWLGWAIYASVRLREEAELNVDPNA